MKLFLSLFFTSSILFSQKFDYEYIGIIKLNKNNQEIISYRLLFNENSGKIQGISITDLEGKHETKNKIEGNYNPKTKEISFKETDILQTKSKINQNSFCFIHFSGKAKLQNNSLKIKGDFQGFFPDGSSCIDGEIEMVSMQKIEKFVEKISKKIEKSKKITLNDKEKFRPTKVLDSLKLNYLKNNENLTIFVKNNSITLSIWDNGQIDEDQIDLFLNNTIILEKYTINASKKIIPIDIKNTPSILKIVAKNEGKITPNTTRLEIKDGEQIFSLITALKENEETILTLQKK